MRNLHLFFGILFSLFLSTTLSAQVTVMASDEAALQGDTVEVNFTVLDFTDLISIQFAVRWDNEVLNFRDVRNFGLENLNNNMPSNNNYGFAQLNEGKLRFSWSDPTGYPISLDDNTNIYTIVFDVVGAIGTQSNVSIVSCPDDVPPILIEIGDENGIAVPDDQITIINGSVNVGTVSTSESTTKDFTLFQNQPNPFNKETNIRFSLKNRTDTNLSIYDYTGKVIFEKVATLAEGEHVENISRSVFPSAGTYFYRLKTDNSDSIRKLIVQ